MEDQQILDLYWARQERAITETDHKYGAYCRSISYHILSNFEDSEECVNDTWLHAWKAIPPGRPDYFGAFLGKIVRNLSISRYRKTHAVKRGAGEMDVLLDELAECVPGRMNVEESIEEKEVAAVINAFLEKLEAESRRIFVRRYFYCDDIKEIAERYSISESKVKSQLFRMRSRLKAVLEKEGVVL